MKETLTSVEEPVSVAPSRFTTVQQAIILALSGAITAIVLLAVVEGMFRAELGAGRKLLQQNTELADRTHALLTKLEYASQKELEYATNLDQGNTRLGQLLGDQSAKVTQLSEALQGASDQLVFQAQDTRLTLQQINTMVVQLAQIVTQLQIELGHFRGETETNFRHLRQTVEALEENTRKVQ